MTTAAVPSIDQMRELALPAPAVSYWPQTWGWLAVLIIVLVLLIAWGIRRYLRWRRDLYRREALARLDELAQSLEHPEQRLPALRELPQLLKRVALSMPAAEPVARLGGVEWQAFLQRHSAAPLPDDFAQRLVLLAYAPEERVRSLGEGEVRTLLSESRRWIEAHHVAV